MGISLRVCWVALAMLWLAPGCRQAPLQQAQQVTQQRLALESHGRELQARVNELDSENTRVNELLAQSQRQVQLLTEQSDAYREQLASAMDQVSRLKEDNAHSVRRVETLQASTRRQGSAMITPNNSLQQNLPALDVPGRRFAAAATKSTSRSPRCDCSTAMTRGSSPRAASCSKPWRAN